MNDDYAILRKALWDQTRSLADAATPEIIESLLWGHDARHTLINAAARQADAGRTCIAAFDALIAHCGGELDDLDPAPLALALCQLEFATDSLTAAINSTITTRGSHEQQHKLTDDAPAT